MIAAHAVGSRPWNALFFSAAVTAALVVDATQAGAMDVVRDGKPAAVIVVDEPAASPEPAKEKGKGKGKAKGKARTKAPSGDAGAAAVLVDWVRKMTDAELPVVNARPPQGTAAIYVGKAATAAGLRLDDIASPSDEGFRVQGDGRRLLVAGQCQDATLMAVCRLLEHWGCRYFFDRPLGEVYPRTKTLAVDRLDLRGQPGFLCRRIWGSGWSGGDLWKTWNGGGGINFGTGHAWGGYVPRSLFAQHPEYFHERDGKREPSDWYCTSNPGLREAFAASVAQRVRDGSKYPSISPPDGRGYCQCPACRAQDDPKEREPSSGSVCITNRYVDFYQHVARRVAKESPDAILSFYCYADYTQAPSRREPLEPNLCAWIAPIRYCRFHAIGQETCPTRKQLAELIDGWATVAKKIGYRTYNYNLSDCMVPFPMLSVWKHDMRLLKEKNCVGLSLETLANWQIYGPHIYLSARLMYDPTADADAVMDDFFLKFYGPQAGLVMKEYWLGLDRAFAELPAHAGSIFALHLVYTPEALKRYRGLIDRATAAARPDEKYRARVEMASEGLRNAEQLMAIRQAIHRGDAPAAKRTYDAFLQRSEANAQSRLGHEYTVKYLKRFVGTYVAAAVDAAKGKKLLAVLPDTWKLQYDEADQGQQKGFASVGFDDAAWRPVATYGNTLDAQGLPDRQTILWYRTAFDVKGAGKKVSLYFVDVDGDATVFVNGKPVGASEKKRKSFALDVSAALVEGRNVAAVRVDHSKITELILGGIVQPVYLVADGG